jgi:hypothetical protein
MLLRLRQPDAAILHNESSNKKSVLILCCFFHDSNATNASILYNRSTTSNILKKLFKKIFFSCYPCSLLAVHKVTLMWLFFTRGFVKVLFLPCKVSKCTLAF